MDRQLQLLNESPAPLLAILSLAVLGLFVAVLALRRSVVRDRRRWKELLIGPSGQDLESLLRDHLREKHRLLDENEDLKARVRKLEATVRSAKRHVGLVRYDAFEDIGGQQSFALALYDDDGNGAVLSGLVGRTDVRVYCKALVNGRSERNLSQEEQRAIQAASAEGPRTIVST